MRLPSVLRALEAPRYRRYFIGQSVSILGTWVQTVAMSWLVYRLTGSAALLGVTAFLAQVPQLVFSPLAGLFIDRMDRRLLFLIIQGAMILQAAALAVLTALGMIEAWHLIVLAGFFGIANGFDTPLRQSMLGRLVDDPQHLRNAVALNASLFNAARFIGPPLAGLILSATSEAWCFALNALSFLGIAAAVARLPRDPKAASAHGLIEALKEGLSFALTRPSIRALLGGVALINLTGSSYLVLMPILAVDVFHGDSQTLGRLLGASGGGALAAAFLVASRKTLDHLIVLTVCGWSITAVSLTAFAAARQMGWAMAAAFGIGLGISSVNISTNALLQSLTPDRIRGRIISYFTAFRFGMDALGGLAAGSLAAFLGVSQTLTIEAALVVVGAFWAVWASGRLRRNAENHQADA